MSAIDLLVCLVAEDDDFPMIQAKLLEFKKVSLVMRLSFESSILN